MSQTLLDEVNIPTHYRGHESGIETITITRYLPNDLGNAWKYAMRYEDKNTPKKDLLKLCWYLNDYRENFIDFNNEVSERFNLHADVFERMQTVINSEPSSVMKEIFNQIYLICLNQGVINPSQLDKAINDVKDYAETFKSV